jgi:lysozyme
MKTSDAGVQFIARFEGLRLKAYDDGVGVWTIGYGHTGHDVHPGLAISMKRALELLRQDLAGAEAAVNQTVKKPLNQSQFDALVSLVFNTGPLPLHKTLGSCLNKGDFHGASSEFAKWCKATKNGQLITLQGLVRRRAAEMQMFNAAQAAPTVHALTHWLNKNEKDWVTHYDALDDAGKGNSPEAHALQEKMRRQRKLIWRLAQPQAKGGDGNGWPFRHRVERYRSLKARTT